MCVPWLYASNWLVCTSVSCVCVYSDLQSVTAMTTMTTTTDGFLFSWRKKDDRLTVEDKLHVKLFHLIVEWLQVEFQLRFFLFLLHFINWEHGRELLESWVFLLFLHSFWSNTLNLVCSACTYDVRPSSYVFSVGASYHATFNHHSAFRSFSIRFFFCFNFGEC